MYFVETIAEDIDSELTHYGIKGMKWGVRRTPEQLGHRSVVGQKISNASKAVGKARTNQLSNAYQRAGWDKETADKKAADRLKVEKTILAAAGITIGAYATYKIASKIGEEYFDKNIRAGTVFQTLVGDPNKHPGQRVYAAYKNSDKTKYVGLYGKELRQMKGEVNAVLNKATTTIKVPSERNARKLFNSLASSSDGNELRQMVDKMAGAFYQQPSLPEKMRDEMRKAAQSGKLSDEAFKKYGQQIFNMGLAVHDNALPGVDKMQQKYFKLLKDAGYNAISDLNDKRYSGYAAKSPVIIFDMGSVTREAVNKVSDLQIQQAENKVVQAVFLGAAASSAAMYGAGTAAAQVVNPTVMKAPKSKKSTNSTQTDKKK